MMEFMDTQQLSDKFQTWQKKARETARSVGETTDSYVRENTWSTLALAAVLGCMIGYMLTSRRD
jgi:ElaB/YqjD/DUF883 family membrane-anchored ribosome-binding protein